MAHLDSYQPWTGNESLLAVDHAQAHNDVAAQLVGRPFLNVKAYGAVGDGVTDDTTAIQAALDALPSSPEGGGTVYVPPGTYKLTDELTMPFRPGMRLIGSGKRASVLKQFTAGKAILRFDTADTHSVNVADMELAYDAPQTNAASIAVKWNTGVYFHQYERLHIINAYRGFSTNGTATPWNNTFADVQLFDIKHEAFDFTCSGGNPVNSLHMVTIFNVGGSVVSTGPCIQAPATELVINGLDVEGWYDQILNWNSGSYITIRGLHVESHKFDSAISYLIQGADAGFCSVDGFSIQGITTANNSDVCYIAHGGANSSTVLRNGVIDVDTTLGAQYSAGIVYGDTAKVYILDNVQLISVAHLTVPSADATTLAKVLMVGLDASETGARIDFGGDTNLYRSAANILKTDDKLVTAAGIGVGNSASASTPGTVTKKMEVFDASGNSLGYVAIYDAIT